MDSFFHSEFTLSESGFLFDHGTGLTYTLNETGRFIFQKIQDGSHANNLVELVTSEFEVAEDIARKDVDDFFRQLKEARIIH